MKIPRLLFIYVPIVFLVFMVSGIFLSTGNVCFFLSGFAVDGAGDVYIGTNQEIEVYRENEKIRSISPGTSRAYAFGIQDDQLVISTGVNVYITDLEGRVLSEEKDDDTETFNKLQRYSKTGQDKDGNVYVLKEHMGRYTVMKNETETVYRMPLFDVVLKYLCILTFISLFIFVPVLIRKWESVASGEKPLTSKQE